MTICSIHPSTGLPGHDAVVSDRFGYWRSVLLPAWLVWHGFWGRLALWTVFAAAATMGVLVGVLSLGSAYLILLLVQIAMALEMPEAMRQRLTRRGSPIERIVDDRGIDTTITEPVQPPASRGIGWRMPWRSRPTGAGHVIGLFPRSPGERNR